MNEFNVLPNDVVYITPKGTASESINEMVRVTVSNIISKTENECIVEGFKSYYDKNNILTQQDYEGKVRYICDADNIDLVDTPDGKKRVGTINNRKVLLGDDENYTLSYLFHASEDIFVLVPICGNITFKTKKEAGRFAKKIRIGNCYLQLGGIYCNINDAVVVFDRYTIMKKDKRYTDLRAKEDLFQHMCNVETPVKQNEYHMVYSKSFLLSPVRFLIGTT